MEREPVPQPPRCRRAWQKLLPAAHRPAPAIFLFPRQLRRLCDDKIFARSERGFSARGHAVVSIETIARKSVVPVIVCVCVARICVCLSLPIALHFPEIVRAHWRLIRSANVPRINRRHCAKLFYFRDRSIVRERCAESQNNRCVARVCAYHRLCDFQIHPLVLRIAPATRFSPALNTPDKLTNPSPAAHWHRRNRNRHSHRGRHHLQPRHRNRRRHRRRRNRRHPHRRRPRHGHHRHPRDHRDHRAQRRQNRSRQPFRRGDNSSILKLASFSATWF